MSNLKCFCNNETIVDSLEDNTPILICNERKCNYLQYLKTTNILDLEYNTEDSENDDDYVYKSNSDSEISIEESDIDSIELNDLQNDANDFITS